MATFLYDSARAKFATAALNWPTAAINAMLVNSQYAPQRTTDQNVSDIPVGAIIARDVALTNLAQAAGVCSGILPAFNALIAPLPVVAVILYVKAGTDATSQLIYYSDNGPGFPFTATGFNYAIGYDLIQGGWFQV